MYDYKHLTREFHQRFQAVERGHVPPPHMIQLFLPFDCQLSCRFCGIHVYRNCKSKSYSRELDYIFSAYYRSAGLPVSDLEELAGLAGMEGALLEKMALESRIPPELLERIDSMARKASMTTAISLPFDVMRETGPVDHLNPDQHRILCAFLAQKTAGVIVREGIDFKLDIEHYLRVVDQAAGMGSQVIALGGFNDIFTKLGYLSPLAARVKGQGLFGTLNTSGFNVDPEGLRQLVKCGWDEVTLSVHAASDETARQLRGVGNYMDHLKLFMQAINQAKKEFQSDQPRVNVIYVINRMNWAEVPDVLEWAEKSGVADLIFVPMWLYSHESIEIRMSPKEEEDLKKLIIKKMKNISLMKVGHNLDDVLGLQQMHVPTMFFQPPDLDEMIREHKLNHAEPGREWGCLNSAVCSAPWSQLTIESRGGPKVCANHFTSPLDLNVTTHTLEEIWYGEAMKRVRSNFLQGRLPLECRKYCAAYPSYFPKKLLAEYLDFKELRGRSVKVPRRWGEALVRMDRDSRHDVLRQKVFPWLLRAGIRVAEPWEL